MIGSPNGACFISYISLRHNGCVSCLRKQLTLLEYFLRVGWHLCLVETRWRRWLRYCATSRKVAGSIPDGVTVALRSTQPVHRADNLGTFMYRMSRNSGSLSLLCPCPDLQRDSFAFFLFLFLVRGIIFGWKKRTCPGKRRRIVV
jgi:hypothetical protein